MAYTTMYQNSPRTNNRSKIFRIPDLKFEKLFHLTVSRFNDIAIIISQEFPSHKLHFFRPQKRKKEHLAYNKTSTKPSEQRSS
jgi:hypothetical protein